VAGSRKRVEVSIILETVFIQEEKKREQGTDSAAGRFIFFRAGKRKT